MPGEAVDGMQPETVHQAIESAVTRARKGEGPTFLEIRTYRYRGHSMSDPAKYRSKEEVEEYKGKDPLEIVKQTILSKAFADEKWFEDAEAKVAAEVNESVEFAENSAFPDPDDIYKDVYIEADYPFIRE